MRPTCFLLLLTVLAPTQAEDSNEVTPPKPPLNLDANLRRALLKALTELENEERFKQDPPTTHALNLPHLDTTDKIVEKASASALSFYTDSSSTTVPSATEKPVVIVQKSTGLQSQPITTYETAANLDPISDAEQFLTSASNNFATNKFEAPRSVVSNGASANSLLNDVKEFTKSARIKIETTTPIVITSSTEESEAKVEDVQFFSAPLVAAFTVHQDETGAPKSVVPIYKQKVKAEKTLEDEIQRLQQQQYQQNYLLRQQQLLHDQQLQLQKQKTIDEQLRVRNQGFSPLVNTATNGFDRPQSTVVSFQPSISLNQEQQRQLLQNGQLPANAQILPVKNAINFRSPFSYNFIPFSHFNQQQSGGFQSFNNVVPQPQVTLSAPKHNRVFRQEIGTANFGHQNQFGGNGQRFFRSNADEGTLRQPFSSFNAPANHHQLNNLLYNSGFIKGRQQEDLNIVSKVLSLNHFGGDYRFRANQPFVPRV